MLEGDIKAGIGFGDAKEFGVRQKDVLVSRELQKRAKKDAETGIKYSTLVSDFRQVFLPELIREFPKACI